MVFYSDLATQCNVSLIVHICTWLFAQFTTMLTTHVRNIERDVVRAIQLCKSVFKRCKTDLDPVHAEVFESTGCMLNSAHLNDILFFGVPCAPWQHQLLWLSLKTWALKWQDMFWLLESLYIPVNTIPIFIDQSTALHCLINLLEVFVIHHFTSYLMSLVFRNMQISCFTSANRWQGETSCMFLDG